MNFLSKAFYLWLVLAFVGCAPSQSEWPHVSWMREMPIREDIRRNLLTAISAQQAERIFSLALGLGDARQGFILFHLNFRGPFDHAEWDRGFTLREPDMIDGGLLVVTWSESSWVVAGDVYPTGLPYSVMTMKEGGYAFRIARSALADQAGNDAWHDLQRDLYQFREQPWGHAFGEAWSHGGTLDILYAWNEENHSWTIIVDGPVEEPRERPMLKFLGAIRLYEQLMYLHQSYFAVVPRATD